MRCMILNRMKHILTTFISIVVISLGQAEEIVDADGDVVVGSTQALGKELFSHEGGFILPFEIVSILLLVAMIGAILLSKKELR